MGYMTNGLSFNTLRQANKIRLYGGSGATTPSKFTKTTKWTASDWVTAITGELGEAANEIKKVNRGDYTLEDHRTKIGAELADVITYLDLLADHLGIDLGAAVIQKFNEVSDRVGSPVWIEADDYHVSQ